MTKEVDTRLRRHLRRWLGRWPPTTTGLDVIGSIRRTQPEWDGRIYPVVGITDPFAGVLSVPPAAGPRVRARASLVGRRRLAAELPELVGEPGRRVYTGVFRWCQRPATLSQAGVWVDADDSAVPDWLRPFGHQVLIARDPETGAYLAGVGIKHHDRYGRELAVGTESSVRGRGLARRLVAQAARRVLDEGAIPTYQHAPGNVASARVAEAAGFPDHGWRSIGLG